MNLGDLSTPCVYVYFAIAVIFLYCELGEMVINQFNGFEKDLCQCKWYLFPIEIQQMLLIFVADAQHPISIRGYGNIVCTRDAFKSVRLLPFWNKYGVLSMKSMV